MGDSLYETTDESVLPSLCRSLWRGRMVCLFWCWRLVWVVDVGCDCFLIPAFDANHVNPHLYSVFRLCGLLLV